MLDIVAEGFCCEVQRVWSFAYVGNWCGFVLKNVLEDVPIGEALHVVLVLAWVPDVKNDWEVIL